MLYDQIYGFGHQHLTFYGAKMYFGDDIAFKGFPAENHNGSLIFVDNSYSIFESSAHKEGAWAFLRMLLDEDWQLHIDDMYFPTNKAAFEAKQLQALEWAKSGLIDITPAEAQANIDVILRLIETAGSGLVSRYDEDLLLIIGEGAEDYFSGMQSAEDAARIIQSRASIYISERNG